MLPSPVLFFLHTLHKDMIYFHGYILNVYQIQLEGKAVLHKYDIPFVSNHDHV